MSADGLTLRRRLRRRFYWMLAVALEAAGRSVPLGIGRALGRVLTGAAARLRPGDRRRARRHLSLAFPDLAPAEVDDLLARSVDDLGRNLFDALAAPRLVADDRQVTEAPDPAAGAVIDVLAGLLEAGRGAFILTGHLGCWELLGAWLARQLRVRGLPPLAVVTGTIHNPAVDRMVQRRRRRLGLVTLPREQGPRPLLRHLRHGGAVAVLQDQNTGAGNLDVPFFGKPAPTATGMARIALRHGVPVLPVALAWHSGRRRHEVVHLEPLPPARSDSGAADERALRRFLIESNGCLETFLRRNPTEWVWFHRRWQDAGIDPAEDEPQKDGTA